MCDYIYINYTVYIGRPRSWNYIRWGGGMGWDVNVHVNLQKQLIVRTRGVGWGGWGGGVGC